MLVPREDNLGNRLIDMAYYINQSVINRDIANGSYVSPGKHGYWRNDTEFQEHDLFNIWAEDTPENDSHVKQLAAEVGELTNQWGIFVTKMAGQGKTWTVANPNYRDGEPADPLVLAETHQKPQVVEVGPEMEPNILHGQPLPIDRGKESMTAALSRGSGLPKILGTRLRANKAIAHR